MVGRIRIISAFILLFCFCFGYALAITPERETEIGRAGAEKLEKKYGLAKERKYDYRIKTVGGRLEKVAPRRNEIKYTFRVLNSKQFNALALPGGYIYATRGLMDKLNDAELAFVLGHEVTHVAHRHWFSQSSKETTTTIGIFAATILLNKGKLNQGSANTAALLSMVLNNQYSQADERTSDEGGVSFMTEAGYDPKYAVTAMQKLKASSNSDIGVLNTFLGSHPLPDDRIKMVREEAEKKNFEPKPGDPPVLEGKDYSAQSMKRNVSLKDYNIGSGERIASADPRGYSGGSFKIFDPDKIKGNDELKTVDYRNLTAEDLRHGDPLIAWEEDLYKQIKSVLPAVRADGDLKNRALSLNMTMSQSSVSTEEGIWVDLFRAGKPRQRFLHEFKIGGMPALLKRRGDFTRCGISIRQLKAGYIHVVVVMK